MLTYLKRQFPKGCVLKYEDNPSQDEDIPTKKLTKVQAYQEQRREKKWELIQQVKNLHQQGLSQRKIEKELELSRKTIKKYIMLTELPIISRGQKPSLIDNYRDIIAERFREGIKGVKIFEMIRAKGYTGSRSLIARYISKYLKQDNCCYVQNNKATKRSIPLSMLKTCLLLPFKNLTEKQVKMIREVQLYYPTIDDLQKVTDQFYKIVEQRSLKDLEIWVDKIAKHHIPELKGFAQGLKKDYKAVASFLKYSWSNGVLEGQVNRLKTLKRQMYGRANFDLLRKKVIYQMTSA